MHQSLRARLTLGFAALTLTVAVVSVVAVSSLGRLGDAVATILRENYRSVIACEEMNAALERQDSAALLIATGHETLGREMLATHRAGFQRAFDFEAHNITIPGEGALVPEVDQRYRAYVAAVDRVLASPDPASRMDAYFRELLPQSTAL